MLDDKLTAITFACGHSGEVKARCADAYTQRYCTECARTKLPRPSECLQRMLAKHSKETIVRDGKTIRYLNRTETWGDWLGPNLGPIGAVIYVRQQDGFAGLLAWSGSEDMFDALEGFKPKNERAITPYIRRFARKGF